MQHDDTYAPLPPRAWTLRLQDFNLEPELHHMALTLAQSADESGRIKVYYAELERATGIRQERVGKLLAKLKELGVLRLRRKPDGRGHPSIWQLVEA